MCGNKMPTKCNRGFYCRFFVRSTRFGHHYAHHQELKSIIQWLLYALRSILQTGHITISPTPDQLLENHSTKYHRKQPLYNILELLMMGIVVPETCWASNKICNKNLCCIWLAFYFHILTTMHGQNHIKFVGLCINGKIEWPITLDQLNEFGGRKKTKVFLLILINILTRHSWKPATWLQINDIFNIRIRRFVVPHHNN